MSKCKVCGSAVGQFKNGSFRTYCSSKCRSASERILWNVTAECEVCMKSFHPKRASVGRYCSRKCASKGYGSSKLSTEDIRQCTECHASIGLGFKMSAKLIGCSKTTANNARKRMGVETRLPNGGSWSRSHGQKITIKAAEKVYRTEWMKDVNAHKQLKVFPDWGYYWNLELGRRKYWEMTPEERKERNALASANRDKEAVSKQNKEWRKNNKEKVRKAGRDWHRMKRATDPVWRMTQNCRGRINEALKDNYVKKTERSMDLIGCGWGELRDWLERQFIGCMSWENYGRAWHVDHITPVSYFDMSNEKERRQCFHYTNLRPLWAMKNIRRQDNAGDMQQTLLMDYVS